MKAFTTKILVGSEDREILIFTSFSSDEREVVIKLMQKYLNDIDSLCRIKNYHVESIKLVNNHIIIDNTFCYETHEFLKL